MNVLLRKTLEHSVILIRKTSTQTSTRVGEKWDLLTAICLERLPVITRDFNEIESKVSETLTQMEYEKSHKSNFEKRLEEDKKRAKDIKEGKLSLTDLDAAPQQTGQDFLDACQEELKNFKFAERINAKEENNLKSTKRALDRRLLLLVQEKIGNKNVWVLPQGKRKNEESSLRESAERILKEKCGVGVHARFLGNAPCGFYKYKYPRSAKNENVGAKIFFFKAQLQGGDIDEKICKHFQWTTRKELEKLQEDYKKSVDLFLIDEEH